MKQSFWNYVFKNKYWIGMVWCISLAVASYFYDYDSNIGVLAFGGLGLAITLIVVLMGLFNRKG